MDFIILTFFNATELIEEVVQISFEGSDNLALILCSKHFREVWCVYCKTKQTFTSKLSKMRVKTLWYPFMVNPKNVFNAMKSEKLTFEFFDQLLN